MSLKSAADWVKERARRVLHGAKKTVSPKDRRGERRRSRLKKRREDDEDGLLEEGDEEEDRRECNEEKEKESKKDDKTLVQADEGRWNCRHDSLR
jgi:hypothetical protein